MRNRLRIMLAAGSLMAVFTAVYLGIPFLKRAYVKLAPTTTNIEEVRARVTPGLKEVLSIADLRLGAPTFIRVFKEEHLLEVWMQDANAYKLFRTYEICNYSGDLGPKLKEGDRQSPEGFYEVSQSAMNPNSSYHLSFNLGFPNLFDRSHDRTGSFLMIHGNCVSIGCYAMTDKNIEEIYLVVEAAQQNGQSTVPVHAFPFRMTAERLEQERENIWFDYWQNLKEGYDYFEENQTPPKVTVSDRRYAFGSA